MLYLCSQQVAGGGLPAKDKQGNIVKATKYYEKHPKGDVDLVQGLKARPPPLVCLRATCDLPASYIHAQGLSEGALLMSLWQCRSQVSAK